MRHIYTLSILLLAAFTAGAQKPKSKTQQGALFPVMKDEKLGYINLSGILVVDFKYDALNNDDLPTFREGRIAFSEGRKWGLLDGSGHVIVPAEYDKIREFRSGYAAVEKKIPGSFTSLSNKTGYIDRDGGVVVKPEYSTPWITSSGLNEGVLVVTLDEKRDGRSLEGYVNADGSQATTKRFYQAGDFGQGLAAVREDKNSLVGYINKQGNYVISPAYSYGYPFNENGVARVYYEDKTWGLIDTKGNTIAKGLDYTPVGLFNHKFTEGLMLVEKDGKFGFVDEKGQLAIPLQYDWAQYNFANGVTAVNVGGTITKGEYGFRKVSGGTWQIIDKSGRVIKKLDNYEEVYGFSEGMAAVKRDGKYGFINSKGEEIVSPRWEVRPEAYRNGLARFYLPGKYSFSAVKPFGYVNKSGDVVWEPSM